MTTTLKDVVHAGLEVVTSHNLLTYLRDGREGENLRMALGIGMATVGYRYGPELIDRLKRVRNNDVSDAIEKKLIPLAGGMLIGGGVGYLVGNHIEEVPSSVDVKGSKLLKQVDSDLKASTTQTPGPLITLGSMGYLSWSVFFRERTRDEKHRQYLGLGLGAAGYLWGPETLKGMGNLIIPDADIGDLKSNYRRSAATLGALAGGVASLYMNGKKKVQVTRLDE